MSTSAPAPPLSERELLERVGAIAGLTLAELAARLGVEVPEETTHAKGWAGQLLERALGASAGSRAEPDFRHLGIELKTLPIGARGQPVESTYVCTVPLAPAQSPRWEASPVRSKLARVLWLPVESRRGLPIAERRIGMGVAWSPSRREEQGLRADWEEFMDLICLGQVDAITAHHGQWLQIRPKAANARARRRGIGPSGETTATLPRGFYLRTRFTAAIVGAAYAAP